MAMAMKLSDHPTAMEIIDLIETMDDVIEITY
jgi:hypothetical protein